MNDKSKGIKSVPVPTGHDCRGKDGEIKDSPRNDPEAPDGISGDWG